MASWPALSASRASSTVEDIRDELAELLGRECRAHQTDGVWQTGLMHAR